MLCTRFLSFSSIITQKSELRNKEKDGDRKISVRVLRLPEFKIEILRDGLCQRSCDRVNIVADPLRIVAVVVIGGLDQHRVLTAPFADVKQLCEDGTKRVFIGSR